MSAQDPQNATPAPVSDDRVQEDGTTAGLTTDTAVDSERRAGGGDRWSTALQSIVNGSVLVTVLAVVLALVACGILIAVTDENVRTAAGYFFATDIYEHEHVPIGLISNAVPGSQIEPFLPGDGKVGGGGSGPDVGEGGGDGKGGGHGAGTDAGEGGAGKFYKTIVEPLAPYALKGFLWYQGESNCFLNDTARYPEKMKTLITGWRKLWGNADLPFYYVQIAPFYYSHSNGGNQSHAPTLEPAFWEAQARALELPHTGMVVTTDLVDSAQELHPPYKWEVGRRLALLALANDYHQPVVCSGPTFQSLTTRGKTLVLTFTNVGSGLVSHDGKPLDWFEVAGTDGKFVPAKAAIQNADEVIIKAKHKPVAVRFGWNEAAQPNLFNKEGLPAMPFRATVNASR